MSPGVLLGSRGGPGLRPAPVRSAGSMRAGTDPVPGSVLGATGSVGQRLVRLLSDRPWWLEIADP